MRIVAVCEGSNTAPDTSTYFIDLDKFDRSDPDIKALAEDIESNMGCGMAGDYDRWTSLDPSFTGNNVWFDKLSDALEEAQVEVKLPATIVGFLELYPY